MKKFILLFFSVFAISLSTKAQDNFERIIFAAKDDTNLLAEAYFNPAMKGFIYGMNSGWYHTAKVHKTFGFDLAFGLSASIVPEKDEIFTLAGLQSINQPSGTITSGTVAGSSNGGADNTAVSFMENGVQYTTTFDMPDGVKDDLPLNAVPTPTLQLSLGLPAKFEVGLRLVPKVGSGNIKGELLGVSLKKELTSLFGPIDKLPLHVSVMGTYTSMAIDYTIEDEDPNDNMTITDGLTEFRLNSYTVQALASLNFPIINLYGGFGYSSGKSTLKMLGKYELDYSTNSRPALTDPLNLGFEASGFRSTIGARLSLWFLKIYGDYTFQEYNTASLGIAISIR